MRSIGRSIFIDHVIRVAMICDDDTGIAFFKGKRHDAANTAINGFSGFHGSTKHASVAHHIGVREIEADEIRPVFLENLSLDGETVQANLRTISNKYHKDK